MSDPIREIETQIENELGSSERASKLFSQSLDAISQNSDQGFRQALARMLLRIWHNQQSWKTSGSTARTARKLLQEFVWTPGRLFPIGSEESDYFGHFTPKISNLDEARAFHKACFQGTDSWQSRVLFPTIKKDRTDESGQLIWANVRTVLREDFKNWKGPELDSILIAPWSRYVPLPEDLDQPNTAKTKGFVDLQKILVDSLRGRCRRTRIGDRTAEVQGGAFVDPEKYHYLIDLQPIDDRDLPASPDSRTLKNSLTPDSFEVGGPSLGLAIFLASWAALSQCSLKPMVATGSIEPNNENQYVIGDVGGLEAKREAVEKFATGRNDSILFLVPQPGKERQAFETERWRTQRVDPNTKGIQRYRVECREKIDDLLRANYLTDGFDSYRKILKVQDLSKAVLRPLVFDQHRDSKTNGYLLQDQQELDQEAKELIARLSPKTADRSPDSGRFSTLSIPFGENPKLAAFALADSIFQRDSFKRLQEKLNPVFLLIDLGQFRKSLGRVSDRSEETLPFDLPRMIFDAIPEELHPKHPDTPLAEEAIANALRVPDKLILIGYESPSIKFWERIQKQKRVHSLMIERLRLLTSEVGETKRPWKPQQVIVVCSDVHQQRLIHPEKFLTALS